MAYIVEPQAGEQVILDVIYPQTRGSEGLRLVVTNQAVLIPAKKFTIVGDPHYLKRVEHSEARQLRIEAIKPYVAYAFSVIMVCVGLAALWSFMEPGARLSPRGIGYGLAILVGGALLPLAAKAKYRLLFYMADGKFKWVPPSVVDSRSKREVSEMLTKVVHACESVNIPVVDERKAA